MGLFDAFTGNPAKKAAEAVRTQMNQMNQDAANLVRGQQGMGLDFLKTGFYGAIDPLRQGFGQARADIMAGIPQQTGAINWGTGMSADALYDALGMARGDIEGGLERGLGEMERFGREGLGELRSGVDRAAGAWDPVAALGGEYGTRSREASDASRAMLGLAGPEAGAAAVSNFQFNPAYQFNLNQGLDAINRARAARGELGAGGNIDRATQEFGGGLASQEWKNVSDRLMGREALYSPLAGQLTGAAAGGRANAYTTGATAGADLLSRLGIASGGMINTAGGNLANLESTMGGRFADLYSGAGRNLADIYGGGAKSLAELAARGGMGESELYKGYGTSAADFLSKLTGQQLGFMGQTVKPTADSFMEQAKAEISSNANFWDMLQNTGKSLLGIPPTPTQSSNRLGFASPTQRA